MPGGPALVAAALALALGGVLLPATAHAQTPVSEEPGGAGGGAAVAGTGGGEEGAADAGNEPPTRGGDDVALDGEARGVESEPATRPGEDRAPDGKPRGARPRATVRAAKSDARQPAGGAGAGTAPVGDADVVEVGEDEIVEQIVVTATRSARAELEVPSAVTVVRPAAPAAPAVATDLLRGAAGVAVQQTTSGQGTPIIRGLIGSAVLTLVDGVRLNNAIFRPAPNQYFALVDPYDIDRIEIVRGAGSTLYGSDALGGVVHVITREPVFDGDDWTVRGRALAIASTVDHGLVGRLALATGRRGLGFGGGLTLQDRGDVRPGGDAAVQRPTAYRIGAGDATLRIDQGRHDATFGLQLVRQPSTPRYDELVPGYGQTMAGSEVFQFEPNSRLLVRGRWGVDGPVTGVERVELAAAFSRIVDDRRTRDTGSAEEVVERNRDDAWSLGVKGVSPRWRGHVVTAGVELTHDIVRSGRTGRDVVTGATAVKQARFADGSTMTTAGVYVQDELDALNGRLTLVPGARASLVEVDVAPADRGVGAAVRLVDATGSLGASYRLSPSLAVVANVGRGFRAPNLYDLSTLGPRPGGRTQIPNPDLRAETVLGADAGLKVGGRRLSGEVFVFASRYRDKIEAVPTGEMADDGRVVVQSRNVARVTLTGVEAAARARLVHGLAAFANILYTSGDETAADGTTGPADRVPPLGGVAGLAYRSSRRASLEAFGRFAAAQRRLSARDRGDPRINPEGTPGWVTAHARVSVRVVDGLRATLAFDNLFDVRYREHASGIDAPGFGATLSLDAAF